MEKAETRASASLSSVTLIGAAVEVIAFRCPSFVPERTKSPLLRSLLLPSSISDRDLLRFGVRVWLTSVILITVTRMIVAIIALHWWGAFVFVCSYCTTQCGNQIKMYHYGWTQNVCWLSIAWIKFYWISGYWWYRGYEQETNHDYLELISIILRKT